LQYREPRSSLLFDVGRAGSNSLQRLMTLWKKEDGKIDKVTAELEATAAKEPQNIGVTEELAEIYTSGKRDAAKAARALEKLLEANPKDSNLQMRLAMFYSELKEYDKAIAVHKKLLETDSKVDGPSTHFQIANLLLQSGKKDEAIAWAKEHLASDAASAAGLLGAFYEQAALNNEAMTVYESAATKAPTPQAKADFLLKSAELARRTKNYTKAETTIRAVIKENASDKTVLGRANQSLIRVYEDQGKIGDLKLDN
jgi:tetratricopeptide (TPR) repeat protein